MNFSSTTRAVLALAFTSALLVVSTRSDSQAGPVVLMPALSANTAADYAANPVTGNTQPAPQVMLTLSRDHQLHYKAYNDYSDIDGDGNLETTYSHTIDYYGYFDAYKCYKYDNGAGKFVPGSVNADKYCSGSWSGNFLNWASMSRLDTMRKLLYGGYRVQDDGGATVLERSNLPTDAHSWAKYYNGPDIAKLTPFSDIRRDLPRAESASENAFEITPGDDGVVDFVVANNSLGNLSPGDQIRIQSNRDRSDVMFAWVASVEVTTTTRISLHVYAVEGRIRRDTLKDWTLTNLSQAGISLCNLTWSFSDASNQFSHTTTQPPLMRVARGNFELWGANEQWQCYWREEKPGTYRLSGSNGSAAAHYGLFASGFSPLKGTAGGTRHALGEGSKAGSSGTPEGEYIVRVDACVEGLEGRERCKLYPAGTVKKPIGLLQIYGDDDRVQFGMVTPSYQKNISGGVLRSNIGSFSKETNADGSFNSAVKGIVSNINALKAYGYDYGSAGYLGAEANQDGCNFRISALVHSGGTGGPGESGKPQNEGNCSSWGNPFSEAYLESLRLVAGKKPEADFAYPVGSKDTQLGLTVVEPIDSLDKSNYCANLNVLAFNASVSSYDDDQMSGIADLGSTRTAADWTDLVGANEAINGGNWFIGNTPTAPAGTGNSCIAKIIPSLGKVSGLCPEAPTLSGTYLIAGAAYYAHTNRIRTDTGPSGLGVPDDDKNSLKVSTYAVSLATNTPKVVIPVPGRRGRDRIVTIIPASRSDLDGAGNNFGPGAIVDFRIISQNLEEGTGSFYVNWENSTQGADYDQDMWGVISYQIDARRGTIAVTTDAIAMSANTSLGFGYIINGTSKDGLHFHSGESRGGANFDFTDPTNVAVTPTATADGREFINSSGGCSACKVADPPTTAIYTLGSSAAGVLQDPLYYAAKYGAFNDSNGNNLPDLTTEWDVRRADGRPGSDGLPDTYFLVSNPSSLEPALGAALRDIVARTASGSAAAVVSNAREGQGAVYQALYEPAKTDSDGRRATWLGSLQSLFIDKFGRLREDGNGNAQLDEASFASDPVISIFYDAALKRARLRRFTGDETSAFEDFEISDVRSVWNARQQLADVADTETQRTYSNLANTGRYLITSVDSNWDGAISSSETVPFVPASFNGGRHGILNAAISDDATNIVRYVRGKDLDGLRSRTIRYNDRGTPQTQRLGDIVQSTPTPVGAPGESYHLLYNDRTYAEYLARYQGRRTVIYAGGNDGVLHAFNGGFFDAASRGFKLTGTRSEVKHPLGSELWGYVPYNLLPHLRWLTDSNYVHVNYVDGKPKVFDARLFVGDGDSPTGKHPYGWGTVMVVGMQLGGGPLSLPTKSGAATTVPFSGFATAPPNPIVTRSAYVVLDITDPESPPTVLAEISDPNMGYSTSLPIVTAFSAPANTSSTSFAAEKWYLVFGSGPDNANVSSGVTSSRDAKVFVYDLKTKSFAAGWPRSLPLSANSFAGDPANVDWNRDFKADNLYIGSVGGTPGAPSGKLYRIGTKGDPSASGWDSPTLLTDPGGPVTSAPSITMDEEGSHWVYAGTGRLYAQRDKASTTQQHVFGVIDRDDASESVFSKLIDTTSAVVTTTGIVSGVAGGITTEAGLISGARASGTNGWKFKLRNVTGSAAERMVSRTALFGEILFGTAFTPATSICAGDGSSRLLAFYYKTGAARSGVPTFGSRTTVIDGEEVKEAVKEVELGAGLASGVALHLDAVGGLTTSRLTAISQTSTAAITGTEATVGIMRSTEVDWRDSRRAR